MLEAPEPLGSRGGAVRDGVGSLSLSGRSVNAPRAGLPRVSLEITAGVRSGKNAHPTDWSTRPGMDRESLRRHTLCRYPSCATDYSRGVRPACAAALSDSADWPSLEGMPVRGEAKRPLGALQL